MNKPAMPGGVRPSSGNFFMLLLLIYNIVLSLGFGFLYVWLANTPHSAFFDSPLFAVVSQVAGFLLPLSVWLALPRTRWYGALPPLPNVQLGRVNIILIVSLCLCLQPAMMLLSALSSFFFPNAVTGILSDWQAYPVMVSLAAVAVTPAFCEEIVFRGYILAQYQQVDIKKAAFINGLFFGIMHLNAQQFLYAFVMGIIFVVFVRYTHSLLASVLAHFTVNATQWLINYAFEIWSPVPDAPAALYGTSAYLQELWASVLYMAVITLIFLPAVLILFRSFLSHNRQRNARHLIREILQTGDESIEKPLDDGAGRVFGPAFWGVLAVYVLFMVLLWLAS